MWFLPTGRTATLPWRVSDLRPTPGGWWRVEPGTMHVLKPEQVRNTDNTTALGDFGLGPKGVVLWSGVCCWMFQTHLNNNLVSRLLF